MAMTCMNETRSEWECSIVPQLKRLERDCNLQNKAPNMEQKKDLWELSRIDMLLKNTGIILARMNDSELGLDPIKFIEVRMGWRSCKPDIIMIRRFWQKRNALGSDVGVSFLLFDQY